MTKAQQFVSRLFYNKFFWHLTLAFFMMGRAVFFVKSEHIEIIQIRNHPAESHKGYIVLGIMLTIVYIGLQGQMYVQSFRALNVEIPIGSAVRLFLKQNLVRIFLPASGFLSLGFFTNEVDVFGQLGRFLLPGIDIENE